MFKIPIENSVLPPETSVFGAPRRAIEKKNNPKERAMESSTQALSPPPRPHLKHSWTQVAG